jgi:hypothetical protein
MPAASLTTDQIAQVSGLVSQHITKQLEKYAPRAGTVVVTKGRNHQTRCIGSGWVDACLQSVGPSRKNSTSIHAETPKSIEENHRGNRRVINPRIVPSSDSMPNTLHATVEGGQPPDQSASK